MAGFNFQNTGKNPIIPVAPKSAAPTKKFVPAPSVQKKGQKGFNFEQPKRTITVTAPKSDALKNLESLMPSKQTGFNFVAQDKTSSTFSKSAWSAITQPAKPVSPVTQKSNTNPIASVALSLAGGAVDTVGKAADFILGGYIRTVGDVKAGVDTALKSIGMGDNVDPYVKLASSGIYSDKSAQDKAAKVYDASMLRNFDSLTGQYKGLEDIPVLSDEKKWLKNLTTGISNSLNEKADVANQPEWAQVSSNIVGSIPYTLVSRIPFGVGAFLNYGTSTMQGIEQKLAESGKDVNNLTSIEKLDIMNYATGSALVNAGSEQIFPAGKGALDLGKALAKGVMKDVVKEGAKYLSRQFAQEGTEEGLSYIGQGIVAMFTTNHVTDIFATKNSDPSKTLLGIASGSALINLVDLGTTVGTAGLSGILFAGFGLSSSYAANKTSNIYSNFKNTKAAYEETKDIPVDQITDEQVKNNFDAIAKDVSKPENAAVVMAQSKVALETMEQNLPVSKQIEMAQNVLQEVYTDDTSRMSRDQLADYTEKVDGLKEKIADLQSQKTVMTSNGTKYTVSQVQQFAAKYEDQVSFYKDAISSVDSPAIKASTQGDLDFANQQLSKYKSMLAQATPKTSAEMLADLQASRMPSSASAAQDVKLDVSTQEAPVRSYSNPTEPFNRQSVNPINRNTSVPVPVAVQKEYESFARKIGTTKEAVSQEVESASKKYKSSSEVESAIHAIQAESLQLDSLPAAEKERAIIKMNLQLFALKKALSSFGDAPSGSRLHGFIDSFSKMLQVGSTKDMKKFIMDSVPIEELTYLQLANKDEIAKSDAKIARGGKDYQEGLLESFMSSPGTMLAPNETVSMSRYAVELTKSNDAATVARGMDALYALKDRLTQAGQFTQSVRAALDTLIPERHAKAVANDLDNKSSDPIQKEDLKKAVKQTKKVVDDAVRKSLDDTVGEFEQGVDKSDSSAVDQSSPKGKKASMEQILSALIKKDITGKERRISTADNLALQVLHNIYLELNPSEKGKATNIFDTLSKMATNKEKYGDVWDKAKPLVEAAIAKENGKREAAGLDELVVPENYLDRFRDPVFTKRMMDQAVRQVLNYNRTDMKSEARKFYLEGGTGENTINRFVSGLRDKLDDAYGQAMPDETFDYLKDHLVKRFKKSLESSRDLISKQIRSQVERSADKNVLNRKSRIDKTIDQLTDSVISGALDDDNLSKIWAAKLGLNYISDEMRTTISERIIEIDKIENEDERFQAYSDFVSQLGSQIRATNIQKFNAWRRFAMLCNPKTWTRNGASNYAYLPYVRVMDSLTYRMQKTMGLDQQYMARGKKHLVAGSNKQIDAIVDSYLTPAKIRTIMEENGKYSLGEHLKREVKIFESKPLEFITKAPLNIISTGTLTKDGKHGIAFFGDQEILKTHLTDAFRNRLNALGYNESLTESDKKAKIASAMDYAKGEALTRTYRAASVISERFTGLKTNVNSDAQIRALVKSGTEKDMAKAKKRRRELNAVNSAIDLAVPFIVTPAAIATEGYRLSPVALGISVGELIGMKIKGTTKTDPYRTAQVSKQISQALVGVGGQWVLGAALALTGAMTGAPPDTDKERKEWALEGKTAYSLYVPGIGWMSYSWCQPVALGIMGGADIATVIKNGGYNVNAIGGAITAGINGVVGATLYGNIVDNLFGGADVATNIKNFLVSGATQTLPTASKALAQTIDPYTRDTYSGTTAQALLYRVLSYIPFASMLQPVKMDIWGNPVKNADMGIGFVGRSILNFIAPFTLPKSQTDVVSQEVIRLFNATGSNSTLPIAVQSGFTIEKGEFAGKYNLSGQDYIDYQALAGQYSFEIAKITIADKRYADVSDADKVKILTKVYSKAVDKARLEFVSTHKTARVK